MKFELSLFGEFGSTLSNAENAARYRAERIESALASGNSIVLNFSGVRIANSSFMNALVAGVVQRHGEEVLDRIIFKGCNPVLHVLVEAAIALGVEKAKSQIGLTP